MSSVVVDLDFQDFSQSSSTHQTSSALTSPSHRDDITSIGTINKTGILSGSGNQSRDLESFDNNDLSTHTGNRQRQRPSYTSSGNWGLAYLAQYFDITTEEVVRRIIWSSLPVRKSVVKPIGSTRESPDHSNTLSNGGAITVRKYSYIERFIQSKPDLYGPLWICVTLIFFIAFFGNTSTYIEHINMGYSIKPGDNISLDQLNKQMKEDWHYNFYNVNLAASCILSYVFVVPIILWFFFWFRGCSYNYSLLETICAYGYSISIFVPISMVTLVQVAAVQYSIVSLGALLSGYVLVTSFIPVVYSDPSHTLKSSYLILLLVAASHALLAFTIHFRVIKPD